MSYAKSFVSPQQTLTSGGALTISHKLGLRPTIVWFELVCLTAELGYSVGDRVQAPFTMGKGQTNVAIAVVQDATNLNIRFSNQNPIFSLARFDTGAVANITNANWAVVFFAEVL